MRNRLTTALLLLLFIVSGCSQHVTLDPTRGELTTPVCTGDLYDVEMEHRTALRGFRGDCKAWTYMMQDRLDMACTAPVLGTSRGQPHMVLGIWHEDGFFLSDVNYGGIVHANHIDYRLDAILVDGRWVKAEIVVR